MITATTPHTLLCDGCRGPKGSFAALPNESSADTRKRAKEAGWARKRGLTQMADICPDCFRTLNQVLRRASHLRGDL